jgi:hypothetical protein
LTFYVPTRTPATSAKGTRTGCDARVLRANQFHEEETEDPR